jgi:hypothetical protein
MMTAGNKGMTATDLEKRTAGKDESEERTAGKKTALQDRKNKP